MIFGYVIFLVIMIFFIWLNRLVRKTFFTVSNYLMLTFSIITGVQVIACILLGYKTATIEYWGILISFIIVALLADNFGSYFAKSISIKGVPLKSTHMNLLMRKNEKKFDIICIVAALYSIVLFIKLAGGFPNIYYIVQEKFQNEYSSGLNFYIRLLMMIATVYYLGCSKISKKNVILGLLCLVPNILTFVKGIVLIPCLGSILLRLKNGDIKISLKAGITIICVGILVFFGVYLIELGIYDSNVVFDIETYQYIGSKMIDYLIAGVQSFSQNVAQNNIKAFRNIDNVTLAPLLNFLSKFGMGESIETVNTVWQTFGFSSIRGVSITSNVNTYIGTLYLYNGIIFGNILNMIWVFVTSFMERL